MRWAIVRDVKSIYKREHMKWRIKSFVNRKHLHWNRCQHQSAKSFIRSCNIRRGLLLIQKQRHHTVILLSNRKRLTKKHKEVGIKVIYGYVDHHYFVYPSFFFIAILKRTIDIRVYIVSEIYFVFREAHDVLVSEPATGCCRL